MLLYYFCKDAYTAKDMQYQWDDTGVILEPGVGMAQYEVINITTKDNILAQRAQGNVLYPTRIYIVEKYTHLSKNGVERDLEHF